MTGKPLVSSDLKTLIAVGLVRTIAVELYAAYGDQVRAAARPVGEALWNETRKVAADVGRRLVADGRAAAMELAAEAGVRARTAAGDAGQNLALGLFDAFGQALRKPAPGNGTVVPR